ncbi:MAG: hypothetical protein U1F67_14650 [Rubrivivax sp.]
MSASAGGAQHARPVQQALLALTACTRAALRLVAQPPGGQPLERQGLQPVNRSRERSARTAIARGRAPSSSGAACAACSRTSAITSRTSGSASAGAMLASTTNWPHMSSTSAEQAV